MKASQLPSGNWRVQVVEGYDKHGKRIVKSFSAPTEWEALKKATDYKSGINADCGRITAREAMLSYIESRKAIISPTTLYGYMAIVDHRLQIISNIDIHKLDKITIQRAINVDSNNGLKYKSIRDSLALLRSACACYNVSIPVTSKFTLPPKEVKHNELPELADVLQVIIGSSVELPCLLVLWCGGMRMSEVRGLQYKDVTTDKRGNHFIYINRSKVCIHGQDTVRDTNKTVGSTRKVPLSDYLYDKIQSQSHDTEEDFIINESYVAIKKRYDRLMKGKGFKLTFHDLRALFATQMNLLGVQKEVLQNLGGWTNSKVLDSVYIRHNDQTLLKSMRKLNEVISPLIDKKTNEQTVTNVNHTDDSIVNHTDDSIDPIMSHDV